MQTSRTENLNVTNENPSGSTQHISSVPERAPAQKSSPILRSPTTHPHEVLRSIVPPTISSCQQTDSISPLTTARADSVPQNVAPIHSPALLLFGTSSPQLSQGMLPNRASNQERSLSSKTSQKLAHLYDLQSRSDGVLGQLQLSNRKLRKVFSLRKWTLFELPTPVLELTQRFTQETVQYKLLSQPKGVQLPLSVSSGSGATTTTARKSFVSDLTVPQIELPDATVAELESLFLPGKDFIRFFTEDEQIMMECPQAMLHCTKGLITYLIEHNASGPKAKGRLHLCPHFHSATALAVEKSAVHHRASSQAHTDQQVQKASTVKPKVDPDSSDPEDDHQGKEEKEAKHSDSLNVEYTGDQKRTSAELPDLSLHGVVSQHASLTPRTATRLHQLLRNVRPQAAMCPHGAKCEWVHVATSTDPELNQMISTHFFYTRVHHRTSDENRYPRLSPGVQLTVVPAGGGADENTDDVVEHVDSSQVFVTTGALERLNESRTLQPMVRSFERGRRPSHPQKAPPPLRRALTPIQHCAHYSKHGLCCLGKQCLFLHRVWADEYHARHPNNQPHFPIAPRSKTATPKHHHTSHDTSTAWTTPSSSFGKGVHREQPLKDYPVERPAATYLPTASSATATSTFPSPSYYQHHSPVSPQSEPVTQRQQQPSPPFIAIFQPSALPAASPPSSSQQQQFVFYDPQQFPAGVSPMSFQPLQSNVMYPPIFQPMQYFHTMANNTPTVTNQFNSGQQQQHSPQSGHLQYVAVQPMPETGSGTNATVPYMMATTTTGHHPPQLGSTVHPQFYMSPSAYVYQAPQPAQQEGLQQDQLGALRIFTHPNEANSRQHASASAQAGGQQILQHTNPQMIYLVDQPAQQARGQQQPPQQQQQQQLPSQGTSLIYFQPSQ